MGVNFGINLCGKKMVTCLARRLKDANENETGIDNIALDSNNDELKRMIKQQLKPELNIKRLILAIPAYLDAAQQNQIRLTAQSALQEAGISTPYNVALVRESVALALDYRHLK